MTADVARRVMRAEYDINDDILDNASCDEIIYEASLLTPYKGKIGYDDTNENVRRCICRELDTRTHPYFKGLHDYIKDRVWSANRNSFGVDLTRIQAVSMMSYYATNEGGFLSHMDTFFGWGYRSDTTFTDRKLSLTLQLSDPASYDGGDLFLHANPVMDPAKARARGASIVFPSFLTHGVNPVTRGVRHALVAWIEGPFWR